MRHTNDTFARTLAAEFGVNPNSADSLFRELTGKGFLNAPSGHVRVIACSPKRATEAFCRRKLEVFRKEATQLLSAGIGIKTLKQILEKAEEEL